MAGVYFVAGYYAQVDPETYFGRILHHYDGTGGRRIRRIEEGAATQRTDRAMLGIHGNSID